jgi:hypothetical protein
VKSMKVPLLAVFNTDWTFHYWIALYTAKSRKVQSQLASCQHLAFSVCMARV